MVKVGNMDHYAFMEVDRSAELIDLKRAHRRLSVKYHPDKHYHETEEMKAMARMQYDRLTEAVDVLLDPKARKKYDAQLLKRDAKKR